MAEKILVTPQALENAATQLRAASEEFKSSVDRCNVGMITLGSTWRDEMYTVANGRYDSLLGGQLVDIPETFVAYADMISGALRVFEGLDQSLKNEIWGLEFAAAVVALKGAGTMPVLGPNNDGSDTPADHPLGISFHGIEHYRHYFSAHSGNCKTFVDAVILEKTGLRVPQDQVFGGIGGPPHLLVPSNNFPQIGSTLGGHGGNVSPSDIESLFRQAQPGDVVQMHWRPWNNDPSRGTRHTAIVHSITESGVKFLESNSWPDPIQFRVYSFDRLAHLFSGTSNEGGVAWHNGASLYRPTR